MVPHFSPTGRRPRLNPESKALRTRSHNAHHTGALELESSSTSQDKFDSESTRRPVSAPISHPKHDTSILPSPSKIDIASTSEQSVDPPQVQLSHSFSNIETPATREQFTEGPQVDMPDVSVKIETAYTSEKVAEEPEVNLSAFPSDTETRSRSEQLTETLQVNLPDHLQRSGQHPCMSKLRTNRKSSFPKPPRRMRLFQPQACNFQINHKPIYLNRFHSLELHLHMSNPRIDHKMNKTRNSARYNASV